MLERISLSKDCTHSLSAWFQSEAVKFLVQGHSVSVCKARQSESKFEWRKKATG